MRIACGQLAAHDLDEAAVGLEKALAMVAAAGEAGADLCVLPEATYPAYVLGSAAAARAVMTAGPDALGEFSRAARHAPCALVVGIVIDGPQGLENAAVHFDPTGTVRARIAKRFLWHFDREWFVAGRGAAPCDDIGMLVCADARLPEIGLELAAHGARVIANPTAWVTAQPPPEGTNPQAEFLWRVRALENRVVAVAATKVGSEAGTTRYSGRSQIVGPRGDVVAVASATEPELLVADVELPDARVSGPARPEDVPDNGAPVRPPLRPGFVQVAVVPDTTLLDRLAGHAVDLVVGPAGVVSRGDPVVVELRDDDLVDPRPARRAALAGAEFVVWIAARVSTELVEAVARTRALENRVFVVVWRAPSAGGAFVVTPDGAISGRAGTEPFVLEVACLRAAAATKLMAPGTDAWDAVAGLGGPRVLDAR